MMSYQQSFVVQPHQPQVPLSNSSTFRRSQLNNSSRRSESPSTPSLKGGNRSSGDSSFLSLFMTDTKESQADAFVPNLARDCIDVPPNFDHEGEGWIPDDEIPIEFVGQKCNIALLFADISGYSRVAALLSENGPYSLHATVNSFYDRMIEVVLQNGGDILKFAGDAMMVVWKCEEETQQSVSQACISAARCALQLQTSCGTHAVEGTDEILRLHIGLTSGSIYNDVLFPKRVQAFHFVSGKPFYEIGDVVDTAKSGWVCASADFATHCGFELICASEPLPNGIVRCVRVVSKSKVNVDTFLLKETCSVTDAPLELSQSQQSNVSKHAVRGNTLFIPRPVLVKLSMGFRVTDMAELRQLYVFFIKKVTIVDTAAWFEDVHDVLHRHKCTVVQVLDDDKGVHVVAALNLFTTEPNAGDDAVKILYMLRERKTLCVVGLAAGMCYCGVVGNKNACRWDISGAACVRACRLMQYADASNGELPFAVDESVIPRSSDALTSGDLSNPSLLRVAATGVPLKGSVEGATVYTIIKERHDVVTSICSINEYAEGVWPQEREFIRQRFFENECPLTSCSSLMVIGPAQSGKKTLLLSAAYKHNVLPLEYRAKAGENVVEMCATIGTYFSYHPNDSIRQAALNLKEAAERNQQTYSLEIIRHLIREIIMANVSVALIIDSAQYMDDASIRLVRDTSMCVRKQACMNMKRGQWVWMCCLTPTYGSSAMRELLRAVDEVIRFPQITTAILGEMCDYFTGTFGGSEQVEIMAMKLGEGIGLLVPLWMYFGPMCIERSWKVQRSELPPEELYYKVEESGLGRITKAGIRALKTFRWRKMRPSTLSLMSQYTDVLPPRLQVILKAIASLTSENDIVVPVWLGYIVVNAMFSMTRTTYERGLSLLSELTLIRVGENDADAAQQLSSDGDKRLVSFRLPTLRELMYEMLTPPQLRALWLKAAKALLDSPNCSPHLKMQAAVLYYRAGDKEMCHQLYSEATTELLADLGKAPKCCCMYAEYCKMKLSLPHDVSKFSALNLQHFPDSINKHEDGKMNDMRFTVLKVKVLDPPLVLGPIGGLVHLMIRNFAHNSFSNIQENQTIYDVSLKCFMSLVRQMEALIPSFNIPWPAGLPSEEALLDKFLRSPKQLEMYDAVGKDFLLYYDQVFRARANALIDWSNAQTSIDLSHKKKNVNPTSACNALYSAVEILNTPTDADTESLVVRDALMRLAVTNWNNRYPYIGMSGLRDAYFNQWLSKTDLRITLYIFLLEAEFLEEHPEEEPKVKNKVIIVMQDNSPHSTIVPAFQKVIRHQEDVSPPQVITNKSRSVGPPLQPAPPPPPSDMDFPTPKQNRQFSSNTTSPARSRANSTVLNANDPAVIPVVGMDEDRQHTLITPPLERRNTNPHEPQPIIQVRSSEPDEPIIPLKAESENGGEVTTDSNASSSLGDHPLEQAQHESMRSMEMKEDENDLAILFETYSPNAERKISLPSFRQDYLRFEHFGMVPTESQVDDIFRRVIADYNPRRLNGSTVSFNEFCILMLQRMKW